MTGMNNKLCPYPFSRMEIPLEPFIPCCQSWLKEDYFKIEAGGDPWNGPAALALRKSIQEGTYQYCHLDRCHTSLIPKEEFSSYEVPDFPMTPAIRSAAIEGIQILADGPQALTLMGDPRCNLACPSCRKEKILSLGSAETSALKKQIEQIQKYSQSIKVLKVAGDGEVFFSPELQNIIRNGKQMSNLEKIEILTNGILFDQSKLDELKPGSDLIKRISVSLDAGDAATYAKVRGGPWPRLLENLKWMSDLRQKSRFEFLGLNFVVRAENFKSLPSFLILAKELEVDEVYLSQLLPWERMPISFVDEAVHRPEHELYGEYLALLSKLKHFPLTIRSSLSDWIK